MSQALKNDAARAGGRVLADALLAQGIDHVFAVPGESYLDVLDGLYVIATADPGALHDNEGLFLDEVARIFGIDAGTVATIRARRLTAGGCPPCDVLGIAPGTPIKQARARYRALIRENHPDRAIAHGLPEQAVRLAESRTRAINAAWASYRATYG